MDKNPKILDLKDEFPHYYNTFMEYKKFIIENPDVLDSLEQYFIISDYKGREIPICMDGETIKLGSNNLQKWIDHICSFKLQREIEVQLKNFK